MNRTSKSFTPSILSDKAQPAGMSRHGWVLFLALGLIIVARKLAHIQPIAVVAGSLIIAFIVYTPFIPFF